MNTVIICSKCGRTTTALDAGFNPAMHGYHCECGGKWIEKPTPEDLELLFEAKRAGIDVAAMIRARLEADRVPENLDELMAWD